MSPLANFTTDSNGRFLLPLPSRSRTSSTSEITVPVIPKVPRVGRQNKRYPLMNTDQQTRPSNDFGMHKRNLSNSSSSTQSSSSTASPFSLSDSESDSASSVPTTPSSSRSPSPEPQPKTGLRLVPRDPFPSDLTLSDISPEDALVFFPDPKSTSRAILLVGPAIARHMHLHSGRSNRCHPYRISLSTKAVSNSLDRRRSRCMLSMVQKQVEEAKRDESWGTWAQGEKLERRASEQWDSQRRSIDAIIPASN